MDRFFYYVDLNQQPIEYHVDWISFRLISLVKSD